MTIMELIKTYDFKPALFPTCFNIVPTESQITITPKEGIKLTDTVKITLRGVCTYEKDKDLLRTTKINWFEVVSNFFNTHKCRFWYDLEVGEKLIGVMAFSDIEPVPIDDIYIESLEEKGFL